MSTTTEDTLTLVLEAISVIVEVAEGKWLDPELARILSQAALDVWARNIKGRLYLQITCDRNSFIFAGLFRSHCSICARGPFHRTR